MTSNSRHPRYDDSRILGDAESHPIEVSSGGSDSEIGVPKSVEQTQGSTGLRIASHSPAPPYGARRTDSRNTFYLGRVSKRSSVNDDPFPSRNTRLFGIKNPACAECRKTKRRAICIHDGFGNEDPFKVHQTATSTFNGRKLAIQATTQQPTSQKVSGDGFSQSEHRGTPTARKTPVPALQRPLSRARSRSDSSEDSDPPIAFPQRRRLNTYRQNRPKVTSTPDPPQERYHHKESQMIGGYEIDSSDSDAPPDPSWKRPSPEFTPSSVDHHLHDDNLQSVSLSTGAQDLQDPQLCPNPRESLLDQTSTSTSRFSTVGSRTSKRHRATHVTSQTAKPIEPIPKPRSVGVVIGKNAEDEARPRKVEQNLRSYKPRGLKQGKAQQNVILGNKAANLTNERPAFGLEDIVPEPKGCSFTIDDIVPGKTPRKPEPPHYASELKEFHDALRMSFAPFIVGPDWILNAPVKKRKFTLADVLGIPQEPLFSIEYALEQYKAHQRDQEERSSEKIANQTRDSERGITEEQDVVSHDEDLMEFGGSDPSEERLIHDSGDTVDITMGKGAKMDWEEAVDNAASILAGDHNVMLTNGAGDAPSDSN